MKQITLTGDVGAEITLQNLIEKLGNVGDDPILINLSTDGGAVYEGLAIYDYLKSLPNEIFINVVGKAFSIGAVILMAADPENRTATPNSKFLLHSAHMDWQGTSGEALKASDQLQTIDNDIITIVSGGTAIDKEQLTALMAQDKIISLNEAIELNFVSRKNGEMDAKTEERFNKLEGMFTNLFNKLKRPEPQNVELQAADGSSLEFPDAETPEEIGVGTSVRIDGSPAPDGEYLMPDGRAFVVVDGLIAEIKEAAADDDMEALKKENEELKAALSEMKTEAEAKATAEAKAIAEAKAKEQAEAKLVDATKSLNELSDQFKAFKNEFSDGAPSPGNPPAEPGSKPEKFTYKGRRK